MVITRLEIRSKAVEMLIFCPAEEAHVDRGHFECRQEQEPGPQTPHHCRFPPELLLAGK